MNPDPAPTSSTSPTASTSIVVATGRALAPGPPLTVEQVERLPEAVSEAEAEVRITKIKIH